MNASTEVMFDRIYTEGFESGRSDSLYGKITPCPYRDAQGFAWWFAGYNAYTTQVRSRVSSNFRSENAPNQFALR